MTNSYKYPFVLILVGIASLGGCNSSATGPEGNSPPTFLQSVPATDGNAETAAYGRAIAETGDGGYLLAGMIQTENQKSDIYVARLSAEGDVRWEKTFGDETTDIAYDLIKTRAGDYVIAGAKGNKTYLLRIDEGGTVNWEHSYNRNDKPAHLLSDEGFAVMETQDGGFAVAGRTAVPWEPGGGASYGPSILRVDEEGQVRWFNDYLADVGKGQALAITQTSEGDFFIPGLFPSGGPFFKVTTAGELDELSRKGDQPALYKGLAGVSEGGYIITGRSFGPGLGQLVATKLSASGEQLWYKTYGAGIGEAILKAEDGNYIIGGIKYQEEENDQIILLKIDQKGKVLWEKSQKLAGEAMLYDIEQSTSGAIIATGRFNFPGWRVPVFPIVLRTNTRGDIHNIDAMLREEN